MNVARTYGKQEDTEEPAHLSGTDRSRWQFIWIHLRQLALFTTQLELVEFKGNLSIYFWKKSDDDWRVNPDNEIFLVIDNAPVHKNAVFVEEPALLKRGSEGQG